VPGGLSASITRTSSSALSFKLTGNAANHANANEISNLTVEFANTAFVGGNASEVSNYLKSNLAIDYIQEYYVASSGGDFTTIACSNCSSKNYDIIKLAGETFTESGLEYG
jgi:hypothetical protein